MQSTAKTQSVLLKTVEELQVRAELEECVRDMITDVEIAAQLEERLNARHQINQLRSRLLEQEMAVAESRALRQHTQQQQVSMADALVQELLDLSKELGELKEIKQQHEELLVQYDEVVAKLIQAEDNIQDAKEGREQRDANDKIDEEGEQEQTLPEAKDDSKQKDFDAMPDVPPPAPSKEEKDAVIAATTSAPSTPKKSVIAAETSKGDDERKIGSVAEEQPEEPSSEHLPAEKAEETLPKIQAVDSAEESTATAEVVATLDEEASEPDDTPSLEKFDTEILMNIFAYLDALDILNTAQINICMYTKVDSLFGLGHNDDGNAATSNNEDNSTIATAESASAAAAHQPTIASTTTTAATSTTTTTTSKSAVPYTQTLQPTIAAPPPPKSKPPPTPVSTTAAGLFSSLLQPRRSAPNSPSVAASARNFHRTTSAPSSSDTALEAQPMTPAMANSMAAKLTDAELNAIIVMRERLEQKKKLAADLTKQNEDLTAKLDGTEAVKQFLIAKVRDMEASISSSVENEIKVAQQIASDQEVIAFLDGRVQELEREARVLRKEKQAAVDELKTVQEQAKQKATVMGDMLQFEREKVKDNEREWKATKKLLIKEVKSCRAQILALQAERDGYREQNETLQRALMNSPNGGPHLKTTTTNHRNRTVSYNNPNY